MPAKKGGDREITVAVGIVADAYGQVAGGKRRA
jgi:hypothetical protein